MVPLAINESYKSNCGYETMWGAEDMLQFYGAILGAISTVIGVYFTLDYTRYNKHNDYLRKIVPILYSESTLVTNPEVFSKGSGKINYVHIKSGFNIALSQNTPNILEQAILSFEKGDSKGNDENIKQLIIANQFIKNYCMIDYTLKNVGSGNAINIIMKINDKLFKPKFELKKDSVINFKFIINACKLKDKEEMKFCISYNYTNICTEPKFIQKETLYIYKKDGAVYYRQDIQDFISDPIQI